MPEDASKNEDKIFKLRHSTAHVMAEAVQSLFPDVKFGIGPAIENGFYYDFDLPEALKEEDLEAIEARMREIIASDLPFELCTQPGGALLPRGVDGGR